MIQIINNNDCCGCGACSQVCPKQCVSLKEDNEGFLYPDVDKSVCINCRLCEKVCPVLTVKPIIHYPIKVYAAQNKDLNIRKYTSSGGVFPLLSKKILEEGGVVFGALFDKKFNVYHDEADTFEDILKFSGPKYVQSNINNSYVQVQNYLKKGRKVLFSGTPCQVAGLNAFLRKKYENLYTISVVCHGVASSKVFQYYLSSIQLPSLIKQFAFRDKSEGWKNYNVKFELENGETIKEKVTENIYMKGYVNNLFLRPICYSCPFKLKSDIGDITLGDCWGIEGFLPEMDDNRGTSLVLINTTNGEMLFSKMDVLKKQVSYEDVITNNPCIYKPVKLKSRRRTLFFENYEYMGMSLVNKLVKKSIYDIILYYANTILRKLKINAR